MHRAWRISFLFVLLAVSWGGAGLASAAEVRYLDDAVATARVFDLIAQRLELMPAVADAKWRAGAPVADPARERAVAVRAGRQARGLGLAAEPVAVLFDLQIRFGREAQDRLHEQWRAQGHEPAGPRSDLTLDLRPRIDALTMELLRAVHLALPGLTAPALEQQWFALAAARLQVLLTEPERRVLLRALAALRRERGPALARIRASGVLRVGTTGDYAPFSAEQAGALHGADIGLAVELAAHLGVEPVFVRTRWSTLLADLAQDRYDVALSGISVTPDRQRVALFSRTYHQGGKTPIARCADHDRFDTLAEINAPGVRVIVNPGGTNERYAREHLNAADVRVHPDNRSVFDEIVAGRADVMITDDVEVELQTRRHPELCRTMPGTLTQARKAILMRRDRALRAAIDWWMRRQIDAGVPSRLIEGAMQTGAHSWPPARQARRSRHYCGGRDEHVHAVDGEPRVSAARMPRRLGGRD